jgi:hypothetical protein
MTPLIVLDIASRIADRLVKSPSVPVEAAEKPVVRVEVAKELTPVIEHLTNNEPWYQSRVTWGAIFAILGGIATIGTAAANGETSMEVYSTAGMSILGGIGTLYGRWKATKPLGAG